MMIRVRDPELHGSFVWEIGLMGIDYIIARFQKKIVFWVSRSVVGFIDPDVF